MTHFFIHVLALLAAFGLGRIHNRKAVEAKIKAAVAEVEALKAKL
jgi:hypothetical protein